MPLTSRTTSKSNPESRFNTSTSVAQISFGSLKLGLKHQLDVLHSQVVQDVVEGT